MGGFVTYGTHLAEAQRDDVGDKDDGAADDERHRRPDVELVRPKGQKEVRRDMRLLIDTECVGRDAEDGQAHQKRQRCGAHPGAVDDADRAHLGLEVEILGVGLEGRRRALGTTALLHFYIVFFSWCFDRGSGAQEKIGEVGEGYRVSRAEDERSGATGTR